MKLSELKTKLSEKEDSILTPELDALLEQHAALERLIKEEENRVQNALKLKYILNREYVILVKEKRVNAREDQVNSVNEVLNLTPETVEAFIEQKSYGIGNWRNL